jgi:predicted class III extradiol MEMO1 family dioxygenase
MTADGRYVRRAHHAGSWYSSDPDSLDETLSQFLLEAAAQKEDGVDDDSSPPSLRGIICPHAGYSYSGPTAAFSYLQLQKELSKPDCPIKHILVFHPSHHYYLDGCAISGARTIETPLGNLPVDDELRDEILQLNNDRTVNGGRSTFTMMDREVDENEHSGEMQYPYIAKAQLDATRTKANDGNKTTADNRRNSSIGPRRNLDRPSSSIRIPILPIMCGNISTTKEEIYGKLLAPIVGRPDVLSIVSTDFCHWGERFGYQPQPNNKKSSNNDTTTTTTGGTTTSIEIFEHIHNLDHMGMRHIEMQEPGAFATYLKETRNTICGRHAVQTWLNAVHSNRHQHDADDPSKSGSGSEVLDISFVKYDQSSQVRSMRDSSVSYASATARTRI